MRTHDYDMIVVGGGLGGSVLAKVIADAGVRVLVLEQEARFKDRVRGEFLPPWGVAEARRFALEDTLQTCGCRVPYLEMGLGPPRDLVEPPLPRLCLRSASVIQRCRKRCSKPPLRQALMSAVK